MHVVHVIHSGMKRHTIVKFQVSQHDYLKVQVKYFYIVQCTCTCAKNSSLEFFMSVK